MEMATTRFEEARERDREGDMEMAMMREAGNVPLTRGQNLLWSKTH